MAEIPVDFISSEHQGPSSSDTQQPGYHPTPDEKKTIQLVEGLYGKAKKWRKRYDGNWIDYYKMFRGKQWKEVRPSYRHSEVINLIFQTIQSMVPILTDSRPKLEFLPTVPTETDLADIFGQIADSDWIHNNWLSVLTEQLYDSHIYGTSFGYIGYDEKANLGLGNICYESYDPFHQFPDPDAMDVNDSKTSKFHIVARPRATTEMKKKYPQVAQYLTSDVIDLSMGDKSDINQVMFKSPVDSKLIVEGSTAYDSTQRDQILEVVCYFKDDSFDEMEQIAKDDDGTPQLDDEGQTKLEYIQKLKYPNGRKIVIAGGVLCYEGPIEFDDGQIPICKMVNYVLPREYWGMGEVEQLSGPQKTLNKIISYALDVLTLMGNPVWKVGTSANIDTDNLFNRPGLIIESDDISQIQREPGVELQPFILELVQRYKSMMDGISGQTDLSRGVEPTNVSAASAIQDLQEAQQTRLRLKSRHIDAFLQQFGKIYISRVFQFYSIPRIVRVTGNSDVEKYFHFHIEKLDGVDAQGKPVNKNIAHITNYDKNGIIDSRQVEITGDFDLRIGTGSALPFAKESKTNLSMNLFKLGVIDAQELLKNIDYPNAEAVLQRVQEEKARMEQQQAQMQAQGGAPPPRH